MSSVEQVFHQLLKNNGYSITTARLTVFRALHGQEPMSMHDLVERSRPIDRASVYRALEVFERAGIVQRIYTGWKYKLELTDKFSEHHHHLTCTKCGRTIPMNETALEQFIEHIARAHGFQPEAHQIEIQGLCKTCRSLAGNRPA